MSREKEIEISVDYLYITFLNLINLRKADELNQNKIIQDLVQRELKINLT